MSRMLLSFRDWLASVLAVGNGVPALSLTTDAESGHLGEGPETGDERALVGFAVHGYLLQIVLVVWIDSELVAGALSSKHAPIMTTPWSGPRAAGLPQCADR